MSQVGQYMDGSDNQDSLHKWQLDLSEELETFKLYLMGHEKNPVYSGPGDAAYIRTSEQPFTNELGAIQIKNRLMGVVNRATSDTNFSEETIAKEMEIYDNSISLWLSKRWKDFGIRPRDYDAVCEMMVEIAISIFNRSIKGWKGDLINAPGNVKEVYYPSAGDSGGGVSSGKKMGFLGR